MIPRYFVSTRCSAKSLAVSHVLCFGVALMNLNWLKDEICTLVWWARGVIPFNHFTATRSELFNIITYMYVMDIKLNKQPNNLVGVRWRMTNQHISWLTNEPPQCDIQWLRHLLNPRVYYVTHYRSAALSEKLSGVKASILTDSTIIQRHVRTSSYML